MSEDIRKETPPLSSGEARPREPGYPGVNIEVPPLYPRTVTAAGVMWIVAGCLTLPTVAAILMPMWVDAAKPTLPGWQGCEVIWLGICGGYLLLYVGSGAFMLLFGIRCVRGTARDTAGMGIGSIVFGLVYSGLVGAMFAAGDVVKTAVVGLGLALLFAGGAIAQMGRRQYKLWRIAQEARRESASRDREADNPFRK